MTTTANPAEAISSALADHRDASAAELAEMAGIGRSTANKFLATLERAGKVIRRPGGHEGGGRIADRWSLATDLIEGTGADATSAVDTSDPPAGGPTGTGTLHAARLSHGELSGLVLDYLAEHAGDAIGPSAVAKALGRSSGAVGNACERLVEAGTLRRTSDAPRRYALAS